MHVHRRSFFAAVAVAPWEWTLIPIICRFGFVSRSIEPNLFLWILLKPNFLGVICTTEMTKSLLLLPTNEIVGRECFQSCLSVCPQGGPCTGLQSCPTIQGPGAEGPPRPLTCSNFFNLDLIVQSPAPPSPWTFSNLYSMKPGLVASGRLEFIWNASLSLAMSC